MKKFIAIIGIVALSATVFLNIQSFSTDSDVNSISLTSLLEMNTASADAPPEGMKRCRDGSETNWFLWFKRHCQTCKTEYSKQAGRDDC